MNKAKVRILSLEDSAIDAELERAVLKHSGVVFEWMGVDNEDDFKKAVESFSPDVVLADYHLPSYCGADAIIYMQKMYPHIPVIVVTGALGEAKAIELMRYGAADFILKDRMARLADAIAQSVEKAEMLEQQEHDRNELIRAHAELQNTLIEFVRTLASLLEMRDPYTAMHQYRVAALASEIAREMGLSEHTIEGIYLAGMVHDIGKIKTPSEILNKPGRITDIEYLVIKQHAIDGFCVLKTKKFPWPIAEAVHQHHERLNGSGYPEGLKGDDIIIEARILAVADVVEAISSHRPYRPGLGIEVALEEIEKHKGILYESGAVDACLKLFREKDYHWTSTTFAKAS